MVSPLTAYWITDVLSDDSAREYIFGRGGSLEFPFPVAVKTGTSQAYHDNWTIGYTKDVTVGVWVGNFDRTPLKSSTGVTGAAPIFHAVMLAATQRLHGAAGFDARAIVAVPDGIVEREVCALSGMPANPWCPARQRERLPLANDPPCSWHHLSDDGLLVIWPPAYRQWAKQNGLMTEMAPRVMSASTRPAVAPPPPTVRGPLEIVNPPVGSDLPDRSDAPARVPDTAAARRCGDAGHDRMAGCRPGGRVVFVGGRADVAAHSGCPQDHRQGRARSAWRRVQSS